MKALRIIIIALSFSIIAYSQQYTIVINPSISYPIVKEYNQQTNQTIYGYAGYNYGYWRELIINTQFYIYYNYHSVYKFALTSIPVNAYNITASFEAYRTSGTGESKIVSLPDNLNFNSFEDCWYYADIGSEYFTVNDLPGTLHNFTGLVLGKREQGYINIGARQSNSGWYFRGNINIRLHISYDLPITVTADNNFPAPEGSNGRIIVDGVERTAPYTFQKNVGQSATLQAISNQTDNQGYVRVWNNYAPLNQSEWRRKKPTENIFRSYNNPYTFSIISEDNNSTYEAQLRKICNLNFQNSFIGVGNVGVIKINNQQYNLPVQAFQVVELNQITAEALDQTWNNINYTFTQWSDQNLNRSRTFYPNAHASYTAQFRGAPIPPK